MKSEQLSSVESMEHYREDLYLCGEMDMSILLDLGYPPFGLLIRCEGSMFGDHVSGVQRSTPKIIREDGVVVRICPNSGWSTNTSPLERLRKASRPNQDFWGSLQRLA